MEWEFGRRVAVIDGVNKIPGVLIGSRRVVQSLGNGDGTPETEDVLLVRVPGDAGDAVIEVAPSGIEVFDTTFSSQELLMTVLEHCRESMVEADDAVTTAAKHLAASDDPLGPAMRLSLRAVLLLDEAVIEVNRVVGPAEADPEVRLAQALEYIEMLEELAGEYANGQKPSQELVLRIEEHRMGVR